MFGRLPLLFALLAFSLCVHPAAGQSAPRPALPASSEGAVQFSLGAVRLLTAEDVKERTSFQPARPAAYCLFLVRNGSETRKADVTDLFQRMRAAKVTDEFGNAYRLRGVDGRIDNEADPASLRPGEGCRLGLYFEPPVDRAEVLTLEFAGSDKTSHTLKAPRPLWSR